MKRKAKAVIMLSKGQAAAVAALHDARAPQKPNQRVKLGIAQLWYMPTSFRKKSGIGRGKSFRVSADSADALRPMLTAASKSGRTAIMSYVNEG